MGSPLPSPAMPSAYVPQGQLPRTPSASPPPATSRTLNREGTHLSSYTHSDTHTLELKIPTSQATPRSRHGFHPRHKF